MANGNGVYIPVNLDIKGAEENLKQLQRKSKETAKELDSLTEKKTAAQSRLNDADAKVDWAAGRVKEARKKGDWTAEKAATRDYTDALKEQSTALADIEALDAQEKELNATLAETNQQIIANEEGLKRLELEALKENFAAFAKNIAKAGAGVGKFLIQLSPINGIVKGLSAPLKRLGSMFKRVFVFNTLTAGMRQMRQAVSNFIKQNNELNNSLKTLKGAFLTAFQPILTAITPYIQTLINWLTRLMMTIANFTAKIFGTTVKKAQNAAKAIAAAGSKAAKSMAGIDEINQLSGGGGGGGAKFDADPTATLDSDGMAAGFAGKIMNAVDSIDWGAIGTILAEGFNKALGLALDFLSGLNFKKMGEAFAKLINGIVNNVDWKNVGTLIFHCLTMALDFFLGLLGTLDIGKIVAGFGEVALETTRKFTDWLSNINWQELGTNIFSRFLEGVKSVQWGEIAKNILEGLALGLVGFMTLVTTAIVEVVKSIINWFKDLFGIHSPSTVFEEFGEMLMQGLINGIKAMLNAVKSIFSGLWDIIKGVINSILGGIESMANGVVKGINKVIQSLNRLSFTIPDWIPLLGGKKWSMNISELSTISIPRLATGTVVPPNKEFMAMLGDNKTETEIVSPLSTMKEALLEALAENGSGQAVVVNVDGRKLFEIMVGQNNNEVRRTGMSPLLV